MDKFKERKFTSAELTNIKDILDRHSSQGNPKDYQVLVDGMTVIERTDDPDVFDSLLDFVNMNTDYKVEVRLYHGNSKRAFRYYLYLDRNKPADQQTTSLEGFEAKMRERDAKLRSELRMEFEHGQLRKDYSKLEADHNELKAYADQLEKDNEALSERVNSRKFHWGDVNVAELGGIVLEGMLRRNTQMLARVPGGAALAGLIEEDNQRQMSEAGMEAEAEHHTEPESAGGFTSLDDEGASTISAEDHAYLDVLRKISSAFSQEDFIQVMSIIDAFTRDPSKIPVVVELLNESTEPEFTDLNNTTL